MGNTIIKASHVGSVTRKTSRPNGPPSEEELLIIERAAWQTRLSWAKSKRLKEAKQKSNLQKKKRAKEAKSERKAKRKTNKSYSTIAVGSEKVKETKKQRLEKPAVKMMTENQIVAKKLGISEGELNRRLNAVRNFNSNSI